MRRRETAVEAKDAMSGRLDLTDRLKLAFFLTSLRPILLYRYKLIRDGLGIEQTKQIILLEATVVMVCSFQPPINSMMGCLPVMECHNLRRVLAPDRSGYLLGIGHAVVNNGRRRTVKVATACFKFMVRELENFRLISVFDRVP